MCLGGSFVSRTSIFIPLFPPNTSSLGLAPSMMSLFGPSPSRGWYQLADCCIDANQSSQRRVRSVDGPSACCFLWVERRRWGAGLPCSLEGVLPSSVRLAGLMTREVISSRKLEKRTFSCRACIFQFQLVLLGEGGSEERREAATRCSDRSRERVGGWRTELPLPLLSSSSSTDLDFLMMS